MTADRIRDLIYRTSWDTRCRGVDTARVIRGLNGIRTILDAGCGEYGISSFINGYDITGIDILESDTVTPSLNYKRGSILDMPFGERSFDAAVSVDVLEHLPADLREIAIGELVRVARRAVIATFPSGANARAADEAFAERLDRARQPRPDWLEEHLSAPFPDADDIAAKISNAASAAGRQATIDIIGSENLMVSRLIRRMAVVNKYLYMLSNTAAGTLSSLLPSPRARDAYRSIVIAKFEDA